MDSSNGDEGETCSTEKAKDFFLKAWMAVNTRSHGSSEPEIYPLVDLFNGTVIGHPSLNAHFCQGTWPFIKGRIYILERICCKL